MIKVRLNNFKLRNHQELNLFCLAKLAIPNKRRPQQRYILSTHESSRAELVPPFVNDKYLSLDFYNWTWTYRRDSDILESYGPLIAKLNESAPVKNFKKKDLPKGILYST